MSKEFEVRWQGQLRATPQQVWEAITERTDAWFWKVDYEPRVGGTERGLTSGGGVVTAWEPSRLFATRAERADGWFNELRYVLEPRGDATHLDYVHRSVVLDDEEYDVELDACRCHTAIYLHTLGQYVEHFAGRTPVHVSVDAPPSSATGGYATMLAALGLSADVTPGAAVRLPDGGEAVVDYAAPGFLGLRGEDALLRFYGRDRWGWPVAVGHHLFGDAEGAREQWERWTAGLFAPAAVA